MKKKSQPSGPVSAPAPSITRSADRPRPTEAEIAQRAHELWQQAGRPVGRDQEHWYEAERQLATVRSNLDNPMPAPAPGERRPLTAETVVDDIEAAFNEPPISREIEKLPDTSGKKGRRSPTSL